MKVLTKKSTYILVVITLMTILFSIKTTQAQSTSPDFVLIMNNAKSHPTVTKFELNGTNYTELCPSGHCTVKQGTFQWFSPPTPEGQGISYDIEFKLTDNVAQKDIGLKKREFLEQFKADMFCKVDDITEENNQEIYYCHDDSTVTRIFDLKRWYYDSTGIYDARADTLTVTGNYSYSS
jgi:hypothetical protein